MESFSARRPAAGTLPAFSLPPPNADVPRASDGLSPSLSSVHTGSSQGSQAPGGIQYSYGGHVHGAWPTPGNGSSYTVSSATQAQPALGQQHFAGRSSSIYSQSPSIQQFSHPRSSQSPATGGEGLPPPPYDQNPVSTQPPTPSSAPAHVDSYTHTRPPSTPSYYPASSTPQQPNFPSYAPQPSPTQHSPPSTGPVPRGLGSLSGQPQGPGMAPPASYRPYSYQSLPTMGGSVMSNIHQPGGQMSMIPGMGVPQYPHHMMYGHAQPAPQSERPFKCDQCVQSFSRNHDLKRHKRIHLAVKPFPCTFCSKSFSRKDALKRHRLVKGCENKANEATNNGDGNGAERSGEDNESPETKREP
ncbi:hypothetical protein BHE90_017242 [Fusarium euwallaceae]|uniref:C2H2-type domain-containing protein n=4 Tax=Fusarium solani species complex TaxID=232080 RepID=A0A3M2RAF4_9HYPO|nr:hypothetical protein CDV36_015462 [Fusarium kuroshium]RSL96586.1 hypothetical protein CEP52_011387 [Fusarium oligoseptatum]RSM17593.1 hypothetical protein CDV31_003518 [Fusarium ambrosium]RTE68380.1 hypothetical protein BHE90_017242 [Fusarium euwallaceae]